MNQNKELDGVCRVAKVGVTQEKGERRTDYDDEEIISGEWKRKQ